MSGVTSRSDRSNRLLSDLSLRSVHGPAMAHKGALVHRKFALVGIIPNQLFSFSSDKDKRTDSRIRRKKHSAAPPGIEPRILRNLVARSNHWATKPQRELRVNFRLSPSCQFFFHYEVTRIARVYKHAATNDNSLDLDPFNRKFALVGIIPNRGAALCFFRLIRLSVLLSLSEPLYMLREKQCFCIVCKRIIIGIPKNVFSILRIPMSSTRRLNPSYKVKSGHQVFREPLQHTVLQRN